MTPRWSRLARVVMPLLLLPAAAVLIWLSASTTGGAASTAPAGAGPPTAAGPAAPRSSAPAITVVGLGDSVMSGTNCNCPGIVDEYAHALRQRDGVAVTGDNLGVAGDTTSDLLAHLEAKTDFRSAVAHADIVLVTIGANDLYPQWKEWQSSSCDDKCYGPAVAAMGRRLGQVLSLIQSLRSGPPATVLVTTYWNVFTDGDVARASGGQAQIDWSQDVTVAANDAICSAATSHHDTCVDLYGPIQDGDPTDVLAPDGDHPNASGVGVIVQALMADTPKR